MKEKTICHGDLFYYDFGTRTGSVQSGTRPVLVIQADDYNRNAPQIRSGSFTLEYRRSKSPKIWGYDISFSIEEKSSGQSTLEDESWQTTSFQSCSVCPNPCKRIVFIFCPLLSYDKINNLPQNIINHSK